jgi:prolyl oligopeptidase
MKNILLTTSALLLLVACKQNSAETDFKKIEVKYPIAQKDSTVKDNYFGTTVADPYRWMENDTSVQTNAWVKAENEVTDAYLANIPFLQTIQSRLKELWNYDKYSAPFKEGDYNYYSKKTGLQNQAVIYRQKEGQKEPEVFF